MKRKRQARILLGILLAALLMLPGAMRIKAEEVVSGEQPAQEVQEPVEELKNLETPVPEIKDPPPEGNEEILPEEPEKKEEPIEEEKPVEPEVKIMSPPLEVTDEGKDPVEKKMPELDLKSFDCDFIWGVGHGDELFDFDCDCDCDIGSKIKWIGMEHFLGMHIKFLPIIDVQCITIEKIWHDDESKDRPCYIMFDLYADGMKVGVLPIVSNHSDTWKTKILVPVKIHGKVINYSVEEHRVDGYKSVVEGFKIINTKIIEPRMRDITVKKVWKESDKVLKPASVNFWLMNGDNKVGDMRTITDKDGWEVTLKEAVFDESGKKINYSIEEVPIQGYDSEVIAGCEEGDSSAATLSMNMKCCEPEDKCPDFTIINTFRNERKITLEKVWDDGDYEGRPIEVIFTLYQNDIELKDVIITKADGWQETLTVILNDGEGDPFEYEVSEKVVPEGYKDSVNGFTITNKRVTDTPEMIKIEGEKTWLDDGTGRPEFINVKLMADGILHTTMKVMPVEGKWMFDFGMLPKYDNEMEEIVYTVSEEALEGYECIPGENFDIVNRRMAEITISGEKTWDDLMNRPASITVYLERNGERFEEVEVKASEMGRWLYSFKETAQFDEKGMPYTFTVSEKYILGYEAKVTGFNILNIQQRATMKVLKVNEADKPLAGAVFEVRDISGKVLKTFTTGADGLFTMKLPLGMYRLVETSPPAGYAKNTVPRLVVLFKAEDVQTYKVVNSFDKPVIVPKPIPTYPMLPRTGAGSEMGFYLFGGASVVFGLLTMKKKKN